MKRDFVAHLVTFSEDEQNISHNGRLIFHAVVKRDIDTALERVYTDDYSAWIVRSGRPFAPFFLASIPIIIKIVEEQGVDVVNIPTRLDDYIAVCLGFKIKEPFPDLRVISTIHGGGLEPEPEEKRIRRDLLSRLHGIIVVSRMRKEKLLVIGVPPFHR